MAGPTGSGKSHLLKATLPSLDRVLVLDAHEEYDLPYFRSIEAADAWFSRVRPPRFRIGLRLDVEETDRALRWAWALRPVVIVVEEAHMSAPHGTFRDSERKGMQWAVRMGRKFGIGVLFATTRPADIDTTITGNCRYIVFFAPLDPLTLQAVSAYVPAELLEKCLAHLASAKTAGYGCIVDCRARTCQLVSPDGPVEPEAPPPPVNPSGEPEPEAEDEDEDAPDKMSADGPAEAAEE